MTLSALELRKYLPLAAGLTILSVIIVLAPWEQIDDLLEEMHPSAFVVLACLSLTYFLSKSIRFWYILRLLGIRAPLSTVTLLYFAGQPFSFLPAGEFYRAVLLEKYLKIRLSRAAPSVTIQGLVEAIILLGLSLVGAFMIGQNRLAVASIALVLGGLIVALRKGWLVESHRFINKLPFVKIREEKYRHFIRSHQQLTSPGPLTLLSALSLVPVLAGIGIVFVSADAIGSHLGAVGAVISYCVPVVVSGLSFLPGGLGVGDGGMIGFLHLFGISTAAAVTITLLMRIFTLAAGVLYGLVAQAVVRWRYDQ